MHFDPRNDKCPLPYSPFKSCTVPRPIGWLSTISSKGVVNLAPYSQWQNLTFDPPMVMFAANQLSSGERKHTVVNAEETGWFVWNCLPTSMNLNTLVSPRSAALMPPAHASRKAQHISNAAICQPTGCVATPRTAGLRWSMARLSAFMSMMM